MGKIAGTPRLRYVASGNVRKGYSTHWLGSATFGGPFDSGEPTVHRGESDADLVRRSSALADSYRVEGALGKGGTATVYLALDLKDQRGVALSVLHPDLAHAVGPERFRREIQILAGLQHPHILTVFDSGDADGMLWYTMPFVEAESLRDRLDRDRELPIEAALLITREVAWALDYAQMRGVTQSRTQDAIAALRDGATARRATPVLHAEPRIPSLARASAVQAGKRRGGSPCRAPDG